MADKIEIPTPTINLTNMPDYMRGLQEEWNKPAVVKSIIESHRPAFEAQSRIDYRCLALGLPVTTRFQMWVNQNPYLAPVDAGLTLAAKVSGALLIVKGVMWLYRFARGGI